MACWRIFLPNFYRAISMLLQILHMVHINSFTNVIPLVLPVVKLDKRLDP